MPDIYENYVFSLEGVRFSKMVRNAKRGKTRPSAAKRTR